MRKQLSKHFFRVGGSQRGPEPFCETCQEVKIWQHLTGQRNTGSIKDFPIHDIQARQNCPFCKLVYGLLVLTCNQSDDIHLGGTPCKLETLPGSAAGFNILFGDYSGMRIRLQKSRLFEKMRLSGMPHSAGDPQMMDLTRLRQILKTCLRDHKRCQLRPLSESTSINILLIDVNQYCLVEKPYNCDRVALSYVWGKDQAVKTTIKNLAEFKEEGSLLKIQNEIPRTIWDSMLLVRGLGQRYLWADSLCIVQDDEEAKREQIRAMDSIYSNSLLTIIAVSGHEANSGLPGVRPNTRPLRCTPLDERNALVATTDDLGSIMGTSIYETRGWTFQERLLSPRRLYVSNWQYFFSCLTETCCEDSLAEKPLRKSFDPHGTSPNSLMRKLASFDGRMLPELAFSVYGEIIENFSTRSLTSPWDTVNAITGINKVAALNLGRLLCAGGPYQLIEYCLIWFHQIGRTPIRNDYFASWSWAGWKCPVSFKLANEIFRDGTRPIFSCRADVHMVEGREDWQYIDMLDIEGWGCNAGKFISGQGRMARLEMGDLDENIDGEGKLVGMFFDTEIPAEPLKTSCWLIGLFRKETVYYMTLIAILKAACLASNIPLPDPFSEMDDLEKGCQVVVLLVEDKGEHVERMGIGIISDSVWNQMLDIERKSFTLM